MKQKKLGTIIVMSVMFLMIGLAVFYNNTTKPDFKNTDIGKCFELKKKIAYLKKSIVLLTKLESDGYHYVSLVKFKSSNIAYPYFSSSGYLRYTYKETKCPATAFITFKDYTEMVNEGAFNVFNNAVNVTVLK